ncbi:MAG: NUMOD4 domain-containing protein [Spirochaetota bacterium]|nr:NUMOD4 domain-containing protein [Spirochaetota bacterium]
MIEIWRPVELDGIPYPYFVSNQGRVRNREGRILKPWKRGNHKGVYHCVGLYRRGRRVKIDLQRLVALHYLPNPEDLPEVNHLDLDHFNNRADNLEWSTRIDNMRHRYFMEAHLSLEPEEVAV